MSEYQQAIYDILVVMFHSYNVNPKDAISAMRKLADDTERITLNKTIRNLVSGPALVQ